MATLPGILAFAPGVWSWPNFCGSPRYHLWNLAQRGWQVLYVDPPVSLRATQKLWKAPDRDFHVLSPSFVAPFGVRKVGNEDLGEKWRSLTSGQMAKRGLAAAEKLGIHISLVWFGAPWHSSLVGSMPPEAFRIYHVYDELCASPALSAMQRSLLWRWERELLQTSQLTLCSSEPQLEKRQGLAQKALLLENAVSDQFLEPLSSQPMRPDLAEKYARIANMPEPRFMYGGVVDHRLDPAYFRALAESIPTGSIILAGKKDPSLDPEFAAEIASNPRFFITGDLEYMDYPAVYSLATVLVLAHRRSEFTDAMYPEKMNEYLSTGKPIVAVGLPEIGRLSRETRLTGSIRVADSPGDFIAKCTEAMVDTSELLREERVYLARQRCWSASGERLDRDIREALDARRSSSTSSVSNARIRKL